MVVSRSHFACKLCMVQNIVILTRPIIMFLSAARIGVLWLYASEVAAYGEKSACNCFQYIEYGHWKHGGGGGGGSDPPLSLLLRMST